MMDAQDEARLSDWLSLLGTGALESGHGSRPVGKREGQRGLRARGQ